jgi:cytochrome c peroxidase
MHTGGFGTLRDVLEHYNGAPRASVGRSELHPLQLSERDIEALEAFLRTLSRF